MKTNISQKYYEHLSRKAAACVLPLVIATSGISSSRVHAAEVVVNVSGITAPLGQIGCSLFESPANFPMNNIEARQVWVKAATKGVSCEFQQVSAGRYAVSVGHDVNGNKSVDTNFIGVPTEQWGVSGNIRPTMRAPRFEEAVFTIPPNADVVTLDIEVAK